MDLLCSDCNKIFKQKSTLQTHKLIHTGEKPYNCVTCNQKFRQYSSLQKHMRIHTGQKPYQCQECPISFSQASNLKRHTLKHVERKPFTCDICEKQFITNQNYQQHLNKHDQQRDTYKCDECVKTFLHKSTLKKHKKQYHSDFEIDKYFQQEQILQYDVRQFFSATHPQILHSNHVDVLFNGRLYRFNEYSKKIEMHEFTDNFKNEQDCQPIQNHQHFDEQSFASLNCTGCPDIKEECCCSKNTCCLACNGGNCGSLPFSQSRIIHFHGPNCGHPIVIHNGHIDYLVNELLHYPHDNHCDNHGYLTRIQVNQ